MANFYITYARRGTNVTEVTRFRAKNEADVRQIFSNQDWLDGCTILTVTKQADAVARANFEARYGLDSVWPS